MNNNYKVYDFMFEGKNKIRVVLKDGGSYPMYPADDIAALYGIETYLIYDQMAAIEKLNNTVGTLVNEEFIHMLTQVGLISWINMSAANHPISEKFKAWISEVTNRAVTEFCDDLKSTKLRPEEGLTITSEPITTTKQTIMSSTKSCENGTSNKTTRVIYDNITPNSNITNVAGCATIAELACLLHSESNKPNNIYGDGRTLIAILQHDGFIHMDERTGNFLPTIDAMKYGLMIKVRDRETGNIYTMVTPDGIGYFLDHYIDRRLECGFDKMINLELIACVNEISRILEQYQSGDFDRMNKREKMLEERRKRCSK